MITEENKDEAFKLTGYSHGAGCGCKISPADLENILSGTKEETYKKLLIGNHTNDDAAVYSMDDHSAFIATTDFFTPIVDDAFDFGRIAAANAISDIYAMGGKPILALAILGWPIGKLPLSLAKKVIEGAKEICLEAGIPLAGGHSIDTTEPLFGLSVNGLLEIKNLKRNDGAQEGDLILITKAIGTGILSTAVKRAVVEESHEKKLVQQLITLNKAGEALSSLDGVHAMTDITGFGLAGHLIEMCTGSGLSASITYQKIPLMEGVQSYLEKRIIPDATYRNWNSYSSKISFGKGVNVMEAFSVLPDPQTNGGLMLAIAPEALPAVQKILKEYACYTGDPIGIFTQSGDKMIEVH
ncbi:MAG: selenide, water dikinase SelD [Bacteroidetes bacterium]|nr:selenide, water dikinase SelD [Bacteroidota bacterium]